MKDDNHLFIGGWHIYVTEPLDFGWNWLPSVQEVAERILAGEAAEKGQEIAECMEFLNRWKTAERCLAMHPYWERHPSIRNGPSVFFLPLPQEFALSPQFVIKLDNNGTTFVVSDIQLLWLLS
jgi:hypothetical protein